MKQKLPSIELTESEYILSAIGNAYGSGLSLEEVYLAACLVWDLKDHGKTFDAAINGAILLSELMEKENE